MRHLIAAIIKNESNAANEVLAAIDRAGYVIVPKQPTKEMLDAAYYDALAEDAAGVWREMIAAHLKEQIGKAEGK